MLEAPAAHAVLVRNALMEEMRSLVEDPNDLLIRISMGALTCMCKNPAMASHLIEVSSPSISRPRASEPSHLHRPTQVQGALHRHLSS